jgi:hypothetical protein
LHFLVFLELSQILPLLFFVLFLELQILCLCKKKKIVFEFLFYEFLCFEKSSFQKTKKKKKFSRLCFQVFASFRFVKYSVIIFVFSLKSVSRNLSIDQFARATSGVDRATLCGTGQ